MSLISQAVIVSTCNLLNGKTWAGNQVFAQPLDPISEVLRPVDGDLKPALAVYIESAEAEQYGRQTQGCKTIIELRIYVYVPPGTIKLPSGEVGFDLDSSSSGLSLDAICRQVDACFHDVTNPWLEIWKKFVTKINTRSNAYILIEVENGVRIPSLEISYSIEAIPDPNFGVPLTIAWQMFDTQLRLNGPRGIALADLFHSLITEPNNLTALQSFQANYGLTDGAMKSTGLGPFVFP